VTAARTPRFRFVQLDVPGRLGIDDGRYLLRDDTKDRDQAVVVVQTLGAAPATPRPRRQRRARRAVPDPAPEVPLTRLTVIPADAAEQEAATRDLQRVARDSGAAEQAVLAALRTANEVLRAHRVATSDPYGHEIGREAPLVTRLGIGTGEGLAEGRWEEAFEVPPPARRRRRAEALRPQERLAAVLAGREPIDVCETLLLRARADLDQGRPREAVLQLRVGLDALLAELPGRAGPDQDNDLAALEDRQETTARTSQEALAGELAPTRVDEIKETLAICERVLRRRQILRS
jgi:hypothetical protein